MQPPEILQDFCTGLVVGARITELRRSLRDLRGVFRDEEAYGRMDPAALVYSVQLYQPVEDGLEGGLFWGSTVVEPGMVGDEYFLTKATFMQYGIALNTTLRCEERAHLSL